MADIIPAILAHSPEEFEKKLKRVEGLVDMVQVDCMDGQFVPDVTFYDGKFAEGLDTELGFDLHLMVKDPIAVLEDWKHVPTLERVTFHLEAVADPMPIITAIEEHGLEPCVAVNPETPIERLRPLVPAVESVLVMGVHPGKSGQEMVPGVPERIRQLLAYDPELPIAVDGGITRTNAKSLIDAGATRIITASAIFKADNIKASIRELQDL